MSERLQTINEDEPVTQTEEDGQSVHDSEDEQRGKKKSRKSDVWNHMTEIEGTGRCKCNYCDQTYKCNTKSCGTSTLRAHIKRCRKNPNRQPDIEKTQKTLAFQSPEGYSSSDDNTCNLVAVSLTKERCRKSCAKYIVKCELSFKHVEQVGFKDFMLEMQPKFVAPSRITVARDIYQLYLEEKKRLGAIMGKQRIALTTDTWRSIQNINYMCVTAHFIDANWTLHKRIINFFMVPNHKGETVSRELESCLREWGITRISTITVDNASSNDSALSNLKKKLGGSLIMDGKFLHVRCCAHIINLIVSEGLKDIDESVDSIRNAVRYVRSSTVRLKKLQECCVEENITSKATLCLDVSTRWNSTYLMLNTALKFQKAFDRMIGDGNYDNYFREHDGGKQRLGPPTDYDWDKAKDYVQFLKTFYDLTCMVSGSSYTTSNLFFREIFEIEQMLNEMMLETEGSPSLALMASKMKEKFNKYWGDVDDLNDVLVVAAVLDPRFKFKLLRHCFKLQNKPSVWIENFCMKTTMLIKELVKLYDTPTSSTATAKKDHSRNVPSQVSSRKSRVMQGFDDDDSGSTVAKNDVDSYLNDSTDPFTEDFDVLDWWKKNYHRYPILALVARDLLAVQVSTVASESAFSGGGRVLDTFRSSLHPRMVEALMCTRDWLLANRLKNMFVDESKEEVENLEASEAIVAEVEELSNKLDASCLGGAVPVDVD